MMPPSGFKPGFLMYVFILTYHVKSAENQKIVTEPIRTEKGRSLIAP